jgi:hypothetical protein
MASASTFQIVGLRRTATNASTPSADNRITSEYMRASVS